MRSKCVAGPATTPSGELSNATSTSITPSDSAATDVTSHYNAALALMSEEDMYDCGWCDPVAADIEENPHDCGWGDGPSETHIDQGWDHSMENPHDCGWEDAVVAKSMGDTDEYLWTGEISPEAANALEGEDPYDCGWDDAMDTDMWVSMGGKPSVVVTGRKDL